VIRYDRAPTVELQNLFGSEGVLHALTEELKPRDGYDSLPVFDVQFREKNKVAVYCGLTKIVNIAFKGKNAPLTVRAHGTYEGQACAANLMKEWDINGTADDFKQALTRYLRDVVVADKQWKKEGAVQVRFENWFSKKWHAEKPFVIIDREAVLGYKAKEEKKTAIKKIKPLIEQISSYIRNTNEWAKITGNYPNELDLIGLSSDGKNLVLAEVKDHSNNKLYYSPLQILYYVLEWENALSSQYGGKIIDDMNLLIEAKKRLGLLPPAVPTIATRPNIQPLLVIDRIDWSAEVQERFREIINLVNSRAGGRLKNLQIWQCPEIGEPLLYRY